MSESKTNSELQILRGLAMSISGGFTSVSVTYATKMLSFGILGLIKRDMQSVIKNDPDVSFMDLGSVKDWKEQTDWRDHTGFECSDERTANFVSKWTARHLAPRDADGNAWMPAVTKMPSGAYSVRVNSYKISP